MVEERIGELYEHYLAAAGVVCTDTRKVTSNSVFFALKGENFNGNAFAAKALEQGCRLAVIDEEAFQVAGKTMLVSDVLSALQQLARHHRRQLKIPVLAITGSNAKTTHKELIGAVLSTTYRTRVTQGNLNNHIGVPLTLLSIRKDDEFAVVEMGANHQGEIAELCRIAEPDFGLITNIGKAHLEGFGGPEGVKKGKSELFVYLRENNRKIFLNGDDTVLSELAGSAERITYGAQKLFDVIGKDCSRGDMVSFQFRTRYGSSNWSDLPVVHTQMHGRFNFINCLAAACVGVFFKVPEEKIRAALEQYVPEMNRSQILRTERNTIILDAYNANPSSMEAAIINFASIGDRNKMLLLGDMFELGDHTEKEHAHIVELLREHKLDNALLVGHSFCALPQSDYRCFTDTTKCAEFLSGQNITDHTILIKGSRGMKMEILKEYL